MELHYKIIGVLLIMLSFIHLTFPKFFNWEQELKSLSLINRQIMRIHTFFIALLLLLMGILCLTSSSDLINTPLGKRIALGLGIFWFIRLLFQFFGYSSRLWRGKSFETAMHIFFSLLWIYFSLVFIGTGVS
ncbi:hypothetical protein [Sphingobacterium hungaricum]|uniref:Uncharacterized protein n=1 Tax=Sphingobacterium hungaricum TaxID=2082723 RepID=A0A928UV81_9SPHI|nr:hypothetical protein [Sphingobacterium hungaricum]MBE8713830.1 hypothetical protein [Sphingobacterium hungaricum]